MDDIVNSAEAEGLFSKRSSSNILSDPRILEHLRIVAEEAQSSEKNDEDAETELAVNKRELSEKIANYNKRNQGAFRVVLKEDLNFEGALRFYFEDGNEKITKALRLTSRSLVSELLPTLIEKFKPDLDRSTLLRKAKLYEVHDEDDREADEICLDPSDYPLDIALNARRLVRFVLRLEYDKPTKIAAPQPNGVAKQQEPRKNSLNSSVASVRSAASDGSSTSGSTQMSKDSHHGNPFNSKFSPSKGSSSSGTPTSSRKNQDDRPSSSNSDRGKNIFKNAPSPRNALGMFFDGVGNPGNQDRSVHQAHKASRVKHQRKRSFGSLLKLKKNVAVKKTVELSTNQLAPGVLKVFGGHVSPGSNYKSVRATELTPAAEIVKEALERYSLDSLNSKDYVLCDVIGFFSGADKTKKENEEARLSVSEKWITEYSRVIGDQEKPLVLQQLWKPITGFSRRFELRKKVETQESSFFQPRGSLAVVKAASVREVKMPSVIKEAPNTNRGVGSISHFESFGTDEGSSSSRPSVVISPFLPPTDTPYLLLIRGYAIPEDHLYHRLDEQIALIGRHSNTPGDNGNGYDEHNPDINLFAPDVLPNHCVLSKQVEAEGDFDLEEECDVNFVVCLDPNKNASVKINGVPISSPIKLSPGDLISLGAHYVYMFKDPTQVLDSSLKLNWMIALENFHEMSKKFNRSVSETDTVISETSLGEQPQTDDDEKGKLRLMYRVENEDRLIDTIVNVSQEEVYQLTPAYLLVLCIEHSSKYHTEVQTRQLMIKISHAIQSVAWEKTTEMSNTIEKDTPPDKAMNELLPQLNPVIFWMTNSMEMLHYLRSNISRYLGDSTLVSSHGDETLTNADEELLVCLEEVVMYTFQQTVYHLTKVLYVALPVILDTNPFQFDDDDSNDKKRPQEIDIVVNIFNQTYDTLRQFSVHDKIVHQLFAYLFFFTNASLFNTLMERGAGGKFYRWAKGAQIRGNLDALESWASQVELQEEYVHYLTRLSTAADLLATPKVQLLQADWMSIRRDFPALNAAQVQQILGEYQLGPGKSRPRGWFPPPEEVEPALRTADILLSFAEHPPLSLPTTDFIFDIKNGPSNTLFYEYLEFIKKSSSSGFKNSEWKSIKSNNKTQRPEPEVTAASETEVTLRLSAAGSLEDLDDIDVPSVTVSPPTPKTPVDDDRNRQHFALLASRDPKDHSQKENPKSVPVKTKSTISDRRDKTTAKQETRQERPSPLPATHTPNRNPPETVVEGSHSPIPRPRSKSPQPAPRGHKKENISEKVHNPRHHGVPSSATTPVVVPPRGRSSGGTTPTESPRESLSGYHVRSSSGGSSASSLSSFGTRDENQNMSKIVRKESDSYKNDGTKWVEVNGSGMVESLNGLSVLPEKEHGRHDRELPVKNIDKVIESQLTDKVTFMSHLQRNELQPNDVEGGSGSYRKLEGMRDGDDAEDDVFIVELEKKESGIGLGLIDGLYTPLRSPGIYVRTLLQGGAAEKDGRLRLGDRILAVNGTSLVGADYQSAMQEIRQAGEHLSFLVAKSDIHVAMKITASSC